MARIIGVDIPDNKALLYSLCYIFGIGLARSKDIVAELKLDATMKTRELTPGQVAEIASHIQEKYQLEGALKRQIRDDISRLKDIKCYRGLRHRQGLPVRGQHTGTNARTRKGKRKTVANKTK